MFKGTGLDSKDRVKVRILAERYPGAPTSHALSQMRTTLIQEIGTLAPVGVAYCRQHLLRKATGPVQRECSEAAASADTMTQRVKSIEQTLLGSHWTVAYKVRGLATGPSEHHGPARTRPPEGGILRGPSAMAFKRARGATMGPEQQGRWQEPGQRRRPRERTGSQRGQERRRKGDVQKKKESGS